MVFMCRPNPVPNYIKYSVDFHETKMNRRKIKNRRVTNWPEIKRMFKLYAFFIFARKFLDLSFFWKFKTSSPVPPYYSSSLYILGIYALRVTPRIPPGSRFTWFAASAERKWRFEVEKSVIHEVSCCFLVFRTFSILDGFGVVWLSISTPWLDFLPGAGLKSLWARVSSLFKLAPALIHFSRA